MYASGSWLRRHDCRIVDRLSASPDHSLSSVRAKDPDDFGAQAMFPGRCHAGPAIVASLARGDFTGFPFGDIGSFGLIPAGIRFDRFQVGMPAGMALISRAAAPPTPRAYRSAQAPAGITSV
jgi:hypothetical protein